jgi:hypothetical protein
MGARWRRSSGALALVLAAGCGDDGGADGGGGGATGAATTSDTSTATAATSTSASVGANSSTTSGVDGTSSGEGGAGGDGGAGGPGGGGNAPGCVAIALDDDGLTSGSAFQVGTTFTPALGEADVADVLGVRFPPELGDASLGSGESTNLATCTHCVLVLEDSDGSLDGSARIFFQSGGLMAVTETDDGDPGRAIVSGLTLVEVTVGEDGVSTPVEGGACLTLEVGVLEGGFTDEWTCPPAFYDADDGCDCDCGIPDPDCKDGTQTIFGCGPQHPPSDDAPGCSPAGECVPPASWTCDEGAFDDGETCDCECGAPDLDCPELPVVGCEDPDEVCFGGACLTGIEGWDCNPDFYDANDGCDCECGIYDPDCDTPGTRVYNCDPGFVCLPDATCAIPPSWSCDEDRFGDEATCDCVCGARDPDCGEGLPVVGCQPGEVCFADACAVPIDNDACADAVPLTEGTVNGTWVGTVNDISPPQSCTGFPEVGGDVFYSVSLAAGETLTVSIDQPNHGADSALYLVTDCTNGATCVAGEDTNPNQPESLSYTAPQAIDLFLVVDQFQNTDQVDFVLTVSID